MAIDAVAPDPSPPPGRTPNPRPAYEGQPYYTFDEVMESISFWDVVDIINPLQHIPIINLLYRELTGDEINGAAQIAGGGLYGGLVGIGGAIVTMAFDEITDGGVRQLARDIIGMDDNPAAQMAASGGQGVGGDGGGLVWAGAGLPAPTPASVAHLANPGAASAQALAAARTMAPLTGADAAALASGGRAGASLTTSLDGTQSAALAAFVAQQTGAGRAAEGPARNAPSLATAAGGSADAMAARSAPAPAVSASNDQQGQDMSDQSRHDSDRNPGSDLADTPRQFARQGGTDGGPDQTAAIPPEIQQGRDALRARLAEARAASGADGTGATAAAALGNGTGGDRPTGMTLADYRANPNRRAETPDARQLGAGGAPTGAVAGVLPDAATMASLLERNARVAEAADSRARLAADGAEFSLTRTEGAFRAMPVPPSASDAAGAGSSAAGASGPVATQPWFSDRVLAAMRQYDAGRRAEPL
jgi:hypothetical protein